MKRTAFIKTVLTAVIVVVTVSDGLAFKDRESHGERLYTDRDPSSRGGIKGSLEGPGGWKLLGVFALPPDNTRHVYKASISGNSFSFSGLPARTYDLVTVFDKGAFEGLQLVDRRKGDTLTREDQIKIDQTFSKSEKFWKVKLIHRMEGTTGRGNEAKSIVTMMQPGGKYGYHNMKEATGGNPKLSFKLYCWKDVGPGWQATKAREIFQHHPAAEFANPPVTFAEGLQRIRVSDYVKDVGKISLK